MREVKSKTPTLTITTDTGRLLSKLELTAGFILRDALNTNIEFIPRASTRTADLKIGNEIWELKSPTGNGKHTIEHQFNRASGQSENIILDARRSKMTMAKFRNQAIYCFKHSKTIKRLIIIDKQRRVTEIKK